MFRRKKKLLKFRPNNSVTLLENGDKFFPLLLRRIRRAQREIFLETFILEQDRVGDAIKRAVLQAAKRGVWVCITVDSYGSHFLPQEYINDLTEVGVIFQIFEPQPKWFGSRPNLFRRLHRKLAVIDSTFAFIGGINFAHNHLLEYGDSAKQDYTVEITGPIVDDIRSCCKELINRSNQPPVPVRSDNRVLPPGNIDIAFICRDNHHNRTSIEKAYLKAIKEAKHRIYIANAYFFPGYRIMHALRKASRRGVDVSIILQGDPDIPLALRAARSLYDGLTEEGIKVYEYMRRPLHAKIAIIDDAWSTIGSSNLDPLSLSFNLEANVVVKDKQFNQQLYREMLKLIADSRFIERNWVKSRTIWSQLKYQMTYHLLRHIPSIIGWFPAHTPQIQQITVKRKQRNRFLTGTSSGADRAMESNEAITRYFSISRFQDSNKT